eukprot:gene1369-1490_t
MVQEKLSKTNLIETHETRGRPRGGGSEGLLRLCTRRLLFLLGGFELYAALEIFLIAQSEETHAVQFRALRYKQALYPALYLEDRQVRLLLCTCTCFLGLLRLSFATSEGGWGPWLCIVAAHAMETATIWSLALTGKQFNPLGYDLLTLMKKVLRVEVGTVETSLVLIAVPLLLLLCLLHGPGRSNAGRSTQRKHKREG